MAMFKRPMGHIAHLRKQLKSINTYDYHNVNKKKKKPIIYFMRIEWFFIWTNLNPLHPRVLCTKFGWNWPSGSGEEDEDVKSSRQRRRTMDKFWSEKLTWAFGSGELKIGWKNNQLRQLRQLRQYIIILSSSLLETMCRKHDTHLLIQTILQIPFLAKISSCQWVSHQSLFQVCIYLFKEPD